MASYSSILRKKSSAEVVKNQRENGVQTGILVEKNYCDRSTGRKLSQIRLVNAIESPNHQKVVKPPKFERTAETVTEPKKVKEATTSVSTATSAIWHKSSNSQVLHRTETTHTLVADSTGAYYLQSQTQTQSVINTDPEEFPSLEGARQIKQKDNRNRSPADDYTNRQGRLPITNDMEGFPTLDSARYKKSKERLSSTPAAGLYGQTELSPFAKPYVFKGFGLITAYDDACQEYSGYCEEYMDEAEYAQWGEEFVDENGEPILEADSDELDQNRESILSVQAPEFVPTTNGIVESDENAEMLHETSSTNTGPMNLQKLSVEADPFELHRDNVDFNGSSDHKPKSDCNLEKIDVSTATIQPTAGRSLSNPKNVILRISETKEKDPPPRAVKDAMELRPSRNSLFNRRASSNQNNGSQINGAPIQLLDEIIVKDPPKLSTDDITFDYRSPLYNRTSGRVGNRDDSRKYTGNSSINNESDSDSLKESIIREFREKVHSTLLNDKRQNGFDSPTRDFNNARDMTITSKTPLTQFGRSDDKEVKDSSKYRSRGVAYDRNMNESIELRDKVQSDAFSSQIRSVTVSNASTRYKLDRSVSEQNANRVTQSGGKELSQVNSWRSQKKSDAVLNRENDLVPACSDDTNYFEYPTSERIQCRSQSNTNNGKISIGQTKSSARQLEKTENEPNYQYREENTHSSSTYNSRESPMSPFNSVDEDNRGHPAGERKEEESTSPRMPASPKSNSFGNSCDSSDFAISRETNTSPNLNSALDNRWQLLFGQNNERQNNHPVWPQSVFPFSPVSYPQGFMPVPRAFPNSCVPQACSSFVCPPQRNVFPVCQPNPSSPQRCPSHPWAHLQPIAPPNAPCTPPPISPVLLHSQAINYYNSPGRVVLPAAIHPPFPQISSAQQQWSHFQHQQTGSVPNAITLPFSHFNSIERCGIRSSVGDSNAYSGQMVSTGNNTHRLWQMSADVPRYIRPELQGHTSVATSLQAELTDDNTKLEEIGKVGKVLYGPQHFTLSHLASNKSEPERDSPKQSVDIPCIINIEDEVENEIPIPPPVPPRRQKSGDQNRQFASTETSVTLNEDKSDHISNYRDKTLNNNQRESMFVPFSETACPLTSIRTQDCLTPSTAPVPMRQTLPKMDFFNNPLTTSDNFDNLSGVTTSSKPENDPQNNNEAHIWLQKLLEKVQLQQATPPPMSRCPKDAQDNGSINPFRLSGNGRENLPKIPPRPVLKDSLHPQSKPVLNYELKIDSKENIPATPGPSLKSTNPFVNHIITESPTHTPIIVPPRDALWFYIDPCGEKQGPFTSIEMVEWSQLGYFNEKVQVRREYDERYASIEEFSQLTESSTPFLNAHSLPSLEAVKVAVTRHSTNPFHDDCIVDVL